MKAGKYLLLALAIITIFAGLLFAAEPQEIDTGLTLLKGRKDKEALVIFERILLTTPDNLDALWGKAEVLRRDRNYKQAQDLLDKILEKDPRHISSLITLAYLNYKDEKFNEALKIIKGVLRTSGLDNEHKALAYVLLGGINGKRSKGWLLNKIAYGTQVKGYFLKAKKLDPDFPEVHLGLGTFYLVAPGIAGGNLDKAVSELEYAVKLAPDFATANARLAQAYKKKGDLEKYNLYLGRAKALDPQNEVFYEESAN